MKINPRSFGLIVFLLLAVFSILAVSTINHYAAARVAPLSGALYAQIATPTEVIVEDVSEIGSTDGIVLMGVIIVLIIVVPILLQRKHWRSN